MTKNHFDVLGLKPGVNEDDLKKAYRKLAKQWHPDKNGAEGAEEKFKEISNSYEYLLSTDRRIILESEIRRKNESQKPSSKPPAASNNSYTFWSHNDFKFGASSTSSQPNSSSKASSTSSKTSNSTSKPKSSHTTSESKENTKPHKKKTHWTDSFTNKEKNKSKNKKSSSKFDEPFVEDLFDDDDDDDYKYDFDHDSEFNFKPKPQKKPPFSFAFQSFVDQLDTEFESGFYPGTGPTLNSSPFGNGYGLGTFPSLSSGVPRPKAGKKETAQESGYSGGLNDEYLFHRPKKSDSTHSQSSTGEKYECNFCNKKFNAQKLIQHELRCGKWKENEDAENEVEADESDEEFEPYPGYQRQPQGHWQDSHTELLNQIKQAKKLARMRAFYEQEQISCKYCGMGLSRSLAEKHQILCARRFSRNQNLAEAKAKQQRASEYSRNVPRPQGGQKSHRNSEDPGESPKPDRGSSDSPSSIPKDFELNGAGIGTKKPGNGCSNCTRKYGKNAKFTCSCGTQNLGI